MKVRVNVIQRSKDTLNSYLINHFRGASFLARTGRKKDFFHTADGLENKKLNNNKK